MEHGSGNRSDRIVFRLADDEEYLTYIDVAQYDYVHDEDEYVGTYITKGEWDSFTGTNKEKMAQILNEYSLIAKTGYASYTLSKLQPSTDYVLFAFGYEGEAPSTDLFYIEFSTTSNADSFISGFRLGAKFAYETFVEK